MKGKSNIAGSEISEGLSIKNENFSKNKLGFINAKVAIKRVPDNKKRKIKI